MAEEKTDIKVERPAEKEEPKKEVKKGSKKLLIIIIAAAIILGAGGAVGYKLLIGKEHNAKKEEQPQRTAVIGLEPFVLNLADTGRYLKFTVQFEVSDEKLGQLITEKNPQLRDAIIMLVSSKPSESISSAEGKFQLKDEMLLRANQIMGIEKNVFKNLYFTEFVMQ